MTAFNWSSVASNQILLSTDTLVIDDQSISAASVLVKWDVTAYQITTTLSSPTVWSSITYGTKTVYLSLDIKSVTDTVVSFVNGSKLLVGDNTTTTGADDLANTLAGTSGADQIIGLGGDDSLTGGAGDDVFTTGYRSLAFGSDTVSGGDGNDWLIYNDNSTIPAAVNMATHSAISTSGGTQQGSVTFTSIEKVSGTAAADTLTGGDSAHGLDTLGNRTSEVFRGMGGNDVITGGAGNNYFAISDYGKATNGVVANLQSGLAQDGMGGTDTLVNVDMLIGGSGNDLLSGGGQSRDVAGNFYEVFRGGAGNDTLDGGALFNGGYSNTPNAIFSHDRADYGSNTSTQAVQVNLATGQASDGQGGTDTLIGITQAYGGAGNDSFTGSWQRDTFDGGAGNDTINGGQGNDVARYWQSTGGVIVNLSNVDLVITAATSPVTNLTNSKTVASNTAYDGMGGTDTLISVESVWGSEYADYILGSDDKSVRQLFVGGGGNDTIDGGAGVDLAGYSDVPLSFGGINVNMTNVVNGYIQVADKQGTGVDNLVNIEGIAGTNSSDTIIGNANDNWFYGAGGSDSIDGGTGSDWATYLRDPGAVSVNLSTGSAQDGWAGPSGLLGLAGNDTLVSIENVEGSDFNDTLTGSSGANIFKGGVGNDIITGGGGADVAQYSGPILRYTFKLNTDGSVTVTDTLSSTPVLNAATGLYEVGDGIDKLTGISTLTFSDKTAYLGTSGNDSLSGTSAAEGFVGFGGNDTMAGGAGDDVYYVDSTSDVVQESAASGTDTLVTTVGLTLPDNVENLSILGGNPWGSYSGNALDNTVYVAKGVNGNIYGGAGNDTLVAAGKFTDYWFNLNTDGSLFMWDGSTGRNVSNFERLVFDDRTLSSMPSMANGVDLNGVMNTQTTGGSELGPNRFWRNSDGSFGGTLPYQVAGNADLSLNGDINQMRISLPKPLGAGLSFSLGTTSRISFSVPGASNPVQLAMPAWQEVPGVANLEAELVQRANTSTFDLLVRQKSGINATDADFINALRSLQLNMLNPQEYILQDVAVNVQISSDNGSNWVGASAAQLGTEVFHFSGPAPIMKSASFVHNEVYVNLDISTNATSGQNLYSRGDTSQGTPSPTLFSITVNGAKAQVLSVTVDHGLRLIIDRDLNPADIVTVAYTSPSQDQRINVLQDRQGNDIPGFTLTAQSDVMNSSGVVGSISYTGGAETRPDYEGQWNDVVFGKGGGEVSSLRVAQVDAATHTYSLTGYGTFVQNYSLDPNVVSGFTPGMYTRERFEITGTNAPSTWTSGQTISISDLLSSGVNSKQFADWLDLSTDGTTVSSQVLIKQMVISGTSAATGVPLLSMASVDKTAEWVMTGNDSIVGAGGADYLWSGAGNDAISGMGGNDSIQAGAGNDSIDGGSGVDTAVYSGRRADYLVTADTAGVVTVRDMRHMTGQYSVSPEGTDTLTNVEYLQFSDGTISTLGLPLASAVNVIQAPYGNGQYLNPTSANDYIDGGVDSAGFMHPLAADNTTLDYSAATAGISINTQTGLVIGNGSVGSDLFRGVERFKGTAFGDVFVGGNPNVSFELFTPGQGNDTIDAGVVSGRMNVLRTFAVDYSNAGSGVALTYNSATSATVSSNTDGSDSLGLVNQVIASDFSDSINLALYGGVNPFLGGGLNGYGSIRVMLGGGNDTLVGNGFSTRVDYSNAWSPDNIGLTVNLTQGSVVASHLKPYSSSSVTLGVDTISNVSGVWGSNYNDTLLGGTSSADTLRYVEQFQAGGGDDYIDGGAGFDMAFGTGYFWLDTSTNNAVGSGVGVSVNLAAGLMSSMPDTLINTGTYQRTWISNGNDTLRGVEAIYGTPFDDVYDATGFGATSNNAGSLGAYNMFTPSAGNDLVTGNGVTELEYRVETSSLYADLAAGLVWGDTQTGLDTITGGVFAVSGGQADDVLSGGGQGRMDEPRLHYEMFMGNGGNDLIDGRGGWDIASYMNDVGAINVDMTKSGSQVTDGGSNHDTLISVEEIVGSAFADTMLGTSNTTGLEFSSMSFMGLEGNDTLDGNGGQVYAVYSRDKAAVTVNLSSGTATDGWGGTDTLKNIMGVVGSSYADTLTGNGSSNVFEGRGGNDTITGGGGADFAAYRDSQSAVSVNLSTGTASDGWGGTDTLVGINGVYGSVFADTLTGGTGNDSLVGGAGNDTLTGGGGIDEARFSGPMSRYTWTAGASAGTVTVTDSKSSTAAFDSSSGSWSVGDGTDTLIGINRLVFSDGGVYLGSSGNDSITASSGADVLDGMAGADTMAAGLGNDTYYVDNTADVVIEAAGAGTDMVMASVAYTLPDNVENLTIRSGGNWATYSGNALDNTVYAANGVNASVAGGAGTDTLVRTGNYADYSLNLNSDGSLSMWDGSANVTASGFEWFQFADRTIAMPQTAVGVDLNGVINTDTINHTRIGPNVWWRNEDGSSGTSLTTNLAPNAELNLGGLINEMRVSLPKPAGSGLSLMLGTTSTRLTLSAPGTASTTGMDTAWHDVPGLGKLEAQISQRAGSSTYDLLVRQKTGVDATDADFVTALRSLQVGMINTADSSVQEVPFTVDISSNLGTSWLGAATGQLGAVTLRLDGTANAPVWSSFNKREIVVGFNEELSGASNDSWSQRSYGTPSPSLFKVTVNGVMAQVMEVTIDSGLKLTLDRPLTSTDTVVVKYTSPTGDQHLNVLQDRSGNDMAGFQLTVPAETAATTSTGSVATIFYPGGLNLNSDLPGPNADQLSGGGDTDKLVITSVQAGGAFTASVYSTWQPNTVLDPATTPGFQVGMLTRSRLDITGVGAPSSWTANTVVSSDAIWAFLKASGANMTLWEDWVQGSQDGSTVSFSQKLDSVAFNAGSTVSISRLIDGVMDYAVAFGNDSATGSSGNDTIAGLRGNDAINGGAGDDVLIGGSDTGTSGGDTLDGGAGLDTAVYSGRRADYLVTVGLNGAITVQDKRHLSMSQYSTGPDGVDTLTNIEYLQFSDSKVAATSLLQSMNLLTMPSGLFAYVTQTSANDYIDGGWDNFSVAHPLAVDNTTLDYSNATGGVSINTQAGTAVGDASVGSDLFRGVERFKGTSYNDSFVGGNPNVYFEMFSPGQGNDTVSAGLSISRVNASRTVGVDYSNAGSAITLTFNSATSATVTSSTDGTDSLVLINQIIASDFSDNINVSLYGGAKPFLGGGLNGYGYTRVSLGGGDDTLVGGGFATRLDYGQYTMSPDSMGVLVNLTLGRVDATHLYSTMNLSSNLGVDTFSGVSGVYGSNFNDTLIGGTTNADTLRYRETFAGNGGDDSIDGGSGFDIAFASGYYWMDPSTGSAVGNGVGVVVNLAAGTMQAATDGVNSTSNYQRFGVANGNDTLKSIEGINGTPYADVFDATGFAGTSTNAGSLGTYNMFMPSSGNDTITGNGATELDYLSTTTGVNADLAAGLVWGDVQTGLDTITGGVFAVSGGSADDVLSGGGQGRTDEPNLHYEFFMGNGGNDLIDGRGGWDIVSYKNDVAAISVDMTKSGSQVTDGGGDHDTLISVEEIQGTAFADTMIGTSNPSGLEFGGLSFMGLEGNDTLDGNGGQAFAVYAMDKAAVTVNLSTGAATDGWGGTDTLRSIMGVVGSSYADTLTGNGSSNVFEGRGGNDTITGGGGGDFAAYRDSASGVTVNLLNGTASDGWGGTDTLSGINGVYGSTYADSLTGGAGNDTFVGGAGNDTINGGAGADEVRYYGPIERYTIVSTGLNSYVVTDSLSSTPFFDATGGRWVVGDGVDTITNVEKLVFGNAVYPAVPSIQGTSYFWNYETGKGHAELSGVKVTEIGSSFAANSFVSLKNVTWDTSGHVTAELWLRTTAAVSSYDVELAFDQPPSNLLFTPAATPSGFMATNYFNATTNHFKAAGAGMTAYTAGSIKLGDLSLDVSASLSTVTGHLVQGKVNDVLGDTWDGIMSRTDTNAGGIYSFNNLAPGSYSLQETRSASDVGSAISAQDALAALKMAVGLNPNNDPDGTGPLSPVPVSPYQYIAADVAGASGNTPDGKVNSMDALAILKMAVGMPSPQAPAPSWTMLPETSVLSGITKDNVNWDNTVSTTVSSGTSSTVNFVGVLKGDVNGSWAAPSGSQYIESVDPTYFSKLAASLSVPSTQWNVV